jgi:hypothetical protein
MGKSKLEFTLFYLAFAFLALGLLRKPLHLPLWSDTVFPAAAILTFIVLFAVRRRNKRAVSSQTVRRSRSLALRLFSLFLIVVVTLSSPWWLPYTGVHYVFSHPIVVAVIECIVAISLYLLGWWYATRRA